MQIKPRSIFSSIIRKVSIRFWRDIENKMACFVSSLFLLPEIQTTCFICIEIWRKLVCKLVDCKPMPKTSFTFCNSFSRITDFVLAIESGLICLLEKIFHAYLEFSMNEFQKEQTRNWLATISVCITCFFAVVRFSCIRIHAVDTGYFSIFQHSGGSQLQRKIQLQPHQK